MALFALVLYLAARVGHLTDWDQTEGYLAVRTAYWPFVRARRRRAAVDGAPALSRRCVRGRLRPLRAWLRREGNTLTTLVALATSAWLFHLRAGDRAPRPCARVHRHLHAHGARVLAGRAAGPPRLSLALPGDRRARSARLDASARPGAAARRLTRSGLPIRPKRSCCARPSPRLTAFPLYGAARRLGGEALRAWLSRCSCSPARSTRSPCWRWTRRRCSSPPSRSTDSPARSTVSSPAACCSASACSPHRCATSSR